MINMSMEQVGTEKDLDIEEKGYIMSGGSLRDEIQRAEALVFGQTMMISETPIRVETVGITVGDALSEVVTRAETVLHIEGITLSEGATRAEAVVIDNT